MSLILSLGACGSGAGRPTPAATPPSTQSAPGVTTPAGTPASTASNNPSAPIAKELAFTATTVGGEAFEGASLAGRDTVLWFWAPWCTVCARSAASVASAAMASPDVRFVGVAGLSADSGAMSDFVDRNGVDDLTHLADTGGDLYTRFGVTQQHTFVLVSADGTVTKRPAYGKTIDLSELVSSTFG